MPAVLWIAVGAVILCACFGNKRGRGSGSSDGDRIVRIAHPHYVEEDDYECPVCGARFTRNVMTCPACGNHFSGTRIDEEEYDEEEDEWDDWDEEEDDE